MAWRKTQIFCGWRWTRTAEILQADEQEAGLSIIDRDGLELVFHSLRHTLCTELAKTRVSEAVIDKIMRHKPTGIGQRFSTHVTDFEIRKATERLPEYPWPVELSFLQALSVSS